MDHNSLYLELVATSPEEDRVYLRSTPNGKYFSFGGCLF